MVASNKNGVSTYDSDVSVMISSTCLEQATEMKYLVVKIEMKM